MVDCITWSRCEEYLFGFMNVEGVKVQIANNFTKDAIVHLESLEELKHQIFHSHDFMKPGHPDSNLLDFFEIIHYEVGKLNHVCVLAKKHIPSGSILALTDSEILPIINTTSERAISLKQAKSLIMNTHTSYPTYQAINIIPFLSFARNNYEQNVHIIFDSNTRCSMFVTSRSIFKGEEIILGYRAADFVPFIFNGPKIDPLTNLYIDLPEKSDRTHAEKYSSVHELPVKTAGVKSSPGEYICDKCGTLFSYEEFLINHKKFTSCVDAQGRDNVCTLCNKRFKKKHRLNVHIRQVHQKIKPYKCPRCDRQFTQSSSLTKHLRVHTGMKPYVCSFCEKRFASSSILSTHTRQHTGEKPFVCIICRKAFASHAAHHSHVRRVHNTDPKTMRDIYINENSKVKKSNKN